MDAMCHFPRQEQYRPAVMGGSDTMIGSRRAKSHFLEPILFPNACASKYYGRSRVHQDRS
jgi:hypothetical protein